MTVNEHLQQRLRELRARRGWSQQDLATKAGVHQPTIWKLEHGRLKHPSVIVVRRLAQAFGVDVDFLVATHDPDVQYEPALAG